MNGDNPTPQAAVGTGQTVKKLWYIIGGIIVLAILGWIFSGMFARNAAERALEQAGVDVDYNLDGSATYSGEEGTVTVGSTSYPDDWPADAPKYPKGEVLFSGSSNPQTGAAGATVSFTTSDSVTAVVDYYKRELGSRGWQIEGTVNVAGATTLSASKDERTFGIWAVAENGATQVTVSVEM